MFDDLIGKAVVVRATQSGVWVGTLVAAKMDKAGYVTVKLGAGRKVWNWVGAGATSGLAAKGPKSGRIGLPVAVVVSSACEVIAATPAAVAAFDAIDAWNGDKSD